MICHCSWDAMLAFALCVKDLHLFHAISWVAVLDLKVFLVMPEPYAASFLLYVVIHTEWYDWTARDRLLWKKCPRLPSCLLLSLLLSFLVYHWDKYHESALNSWRFIITLRAVLVESEPHRSTPPSWALLTAYFVCCAILALLVGVSTVNIVRAWLLVI